MNQRFALVIFAFAFMVAIVVGFYSPSDDGKPAPSEFRAKFKETLLPGAKQPEAKPAVPSPKPTAGRNPSSVKEGGEPLSKEAFLNKYGEKISVTADGGKVIRLDGISVRSEDLSPDQKVKDFRPSHSGDLLKRAKEILVDARALLGTPSYTEFDEGTSTPGESSGQVVFQQKLNGTPLYPGGLVTILMGADGQLRTLDSSVYPSAEIENSQTLPQPEASRSVLYVTQAEPKVTLKYAYETITKGIQTLTDAQTGEVLFTRDRRIR